nr:TonB-dependent receptor [Pelobium sp.]
MFSVLGYAQNAKQPVKPDITITASGIVVDYNGKPMDAVNISIQEKTQSNFTGKDGKFSIECSSSAMVVFQKNGYNTVLKPAGELADGKITMIASLIDAGDNDNVFIPFGIRKKRAVTASISTINGSELPQIPLSSLPNSLAGRISGLYVQQTGSRPGTDDATFLVRGRSSYNSNQAPLVLIDGVQRDFSDMDLNEVESISVLKDAASLSWYGMNAANGVVYVTTKRGSATKTKVSFDAQGGVQAPINITKPLDSYNYALQINQALINDGGTARYDQTALDAYQSGSDPYTYPNNNLVDRFFKNFAPVQRYVATVSGGNSFARYFTLLSYYNQDGLYNETKTDNYNSNSNFKRYNFRTNLDLHVNKNLDVSLDVGGRLGALRYPRDGNGTLLNTLYLTPPNAFPLINQDGSYGGNSTFKTNPLVLLQSRGITTDQTRRLLATINAKQKLGFLLDGLSANLFYTYDINGLYSSGFSEDAPVYEMVSPGAYTYRGGIVSPLAYTSSTFDGSVRQNEFWGGLDYDKTFGKHQFNFSTRLQRTVSASPSNLDTRREGISNRLSYNYNQRYFLDAVATYSGSQNFMPGKRFGWFPAVSAGWIISDENFLKSTKFLNYLKLRGSVGIVGNGGISQRLFAFNDYYDRGGSSYVFGTSYSATTNTTQQPLANPNLTWEKAKKASLGFDSKLFNQALSIDFDYFYERRSDLLTSALLPNVLGANVVNVNNGEAEYKGLETSLNYTKKFNKVSVDIFGNFTYAKSKILSINEDAGLKDYQKQVGFPIGGVVNGTGFTRMFLISDGIFQNQAEIDAAPKQLFSGTTRPGDLRYKDIGGPNGVPDGVIDNFDFKMTDYSDVPKAYYGFGTTVKFMNFDVSAIFQGVYGRTIQIKDIVNSGNSNTGYINQFSLDNFTPATAATAKWPRSGIADRSNNTQNSDFYLRSGDFLRLKNLEIGYTLNQKFTNRLKIGTCRFYLNGFNLFSFDKLDVPVDPEIPSAGYATAYPQTYPYLRTFSAGMNIKF